MHCVPTEDELRRVFGPIFEDAQRAQMDQKAIKGKDQSTKPRPKRRRMNGGDTPPSSSDDDDDVGQYDNDGIAAQNKRNDQCRAMTLYTVGRCNMDDAELKRSAAACLREVTMDHTSDGRPRVWQDHKGKKLKVRALVAPKSGEQLQWVRVSVMSDSGVLNAQRNCSGFVLCVGTDPEDVRAIEAAFDPLSDNKPYTTLVHIAEARLDMAEIRDVRPESMECAGINCTEQMKPGWFIEGHGPFVVEGWLLSELVNNGKGEIARRTGIYEWIPADRSKKLVLTRRCVHTRWKQ